jgi:hypothetical protein
VAEQVIWEAVLEVEEELGAGDDFHPSSAGGW